MKLAFDVPKSKKIRLIINTDAKNEADDQFAIVHALLTPRFDIKGIIAAQFEHGATLSKRSPGTMQASYDEIEKLLTLMDLKGKVPVYKGAERMMSDERTPEPSEGAELIIREAMKDDPSPLYAIFLGPLTDMASAYLMEPKIEDRLTVIWIGGGHWPNGGWEFNLSNDPHSANVVFGSRLPLWQVPHTVYTTIRTSIAELKARVQPCGEIGNYLYQQLVEFNEWAADRNPNGAWPKGEMWSLGDSPAVSLLLDEHEYGYEWKPAPRIDVETLHYIHYQNERQIRVYHYVDPRFTLEDMFAKLALHYG